MPHFMLSVHTATGAPREPLSHEAQRAAGSRGR
jgi:hypothetical protein